MKLLSNRRHRVAAAVTAAAIAVGGGAAAVTALAAPAAQGTASLSAATAPASGTPAHAGAKGGHHGKGHLLSRADHASIQLRVKGQWVTFDLDRGTVTSVSASSITIARKDGSSVTEKIDSATKFRGAASAAAVTDGSRATVISEDGTARRVAERAQHTKTTPATSSSGATTPA